MLRLRSNPFQGLALQVDADTPLEADVVQFRRGKPWLLKDRHKLAEQSVSSRYPNGTLFMMQVLEETLRDKELGLRRVQMVPLELISGEVKID